MSTPNAPAVDPLILGRPTRTETHYGRRLHRTMRGRADGSKRSGHPHVAQVAYLPALVPRSGLFVFARQGGGAKNATAAQNSSTARLHLAAQREKSCRRQHVSRDSAIMAAACRISSHVASPPSISRAASMCAARCCSLGPSVSASPPVGTAAEGAGSCTGTGAATPSTHAPGACTALKTVEVGASMRVGRR